MVMHYNETEKKAWIHEGFRYIVMNLAYYELNMSATCSQFVNTAFGFGMIGLYDQWDGEKISRIYST